jgi:hypothetical protein
MNRGRRLCQRHGSREINRPREIKRRRVRAITWQNLSTMVCRTGGAAIDDMLCCALRQLLVTFPHFQSLTQFCVPKCSFRRSDDLPG